jgi:hypothetical protein
MFLQIYSDFLYRRKGLNENSDSRKRMQDDGIGLKKERPSNGSYNNNAI